MNICMQNYLSLILIIIVRFNFGKKLLFTYRSLLYWENAKKRINNLYITRQKNAKDLLNSRVNVINMKEKSQAGRFVLDGIADIQTSRLRQEKRGSKLLHT